MDTIYSTDAGIKPDKAIGLERRYSINNVAIPVLKYVALTEQNGQLSTHLRLSPHPFLSRPRAPTRPAVIRLLRPLDKSMNKSEFVFVPSCFLYCIPPVARFRQC